MVERRRVGAEASSAAAGMIAPQSTEPGSPLLPLALRGRDRHFELVPALEDETGIGLDLSRLGCLDLAFDDEGERALDERREAHERQGLPVEALGAADVRDCEPNVSRAVRKGLFFAGDRRIDNVRLTRALAASAVARGASLLTGRPVTALLVESGRVAGVRAGSETLRAPVVINAAGAWAGLLPGDPEPPPVEPVRGQIVVFETSPPLLRHVVCSPRGYLVPRSDGRILAGSTTEKAGYDKAVTAGGVRALLDMSLELAPSRSPTCGSPMPGPASGRAPPTDCRSSGRARCPAWSTPAVSTATASCSVRWWASWRRASRAAVRPSPRWRRSRPRASPTRADRARSELPHRVTPRTPAGSAARVLCARYGMRACARATGSV